MRAYRPCGRAACGRIAHAGVRHAGVSPIHAGVSSIPARCAPCPMLMLLALALVVHRRLRALNSCNFLHNGRIAAQGRASAPRGRSFVAGTGAAHGTVPARVVLCTARSRSAVPSSPPPCRWARMTTMAAAVRLHAGAHMVAAAPGLMTHVLPRGGGSSLYSGRPSVRPPHDRGVSTNHRLRKKFCHLKSAE